MKINLFKKEFKSYNNRVVKCTLFTRVTMFDGSEPMITQSFQTVGRAKCHTEETFNENIGKKIAYDRAYKRALNKIQRITANQVEYLKNATVLAEKDAAKAVRLVETFVPYENVLMEGE